MIIKVDEKKEMPIEKEIKHIINCVNRICKKNNIKYLLLWDAYNLTGKAFTAIYLNNKELFDNDLIIYSKANKGFANLRNDDFLTYEVNNYFLENKIAVIDTNTVEESLKTGTNLNGNIKVFCDYTTKYIEEILSYYNIWITKTIEELELNVILRDYVLLDRKDFNEKYTKEQIVDLLTKIKPVKQKNFTVYNSATTRYIKDAQDVQI